MLARTRDPADRLQDRVEQVRQRFEQARDGADQLISAAERIFGRSKRVHKEPAPDGRTRMRVHRPGRITTIPSASQRLILQLSCVHSISAYASDPSSELLNWHHVKHDRDG
jgi:hypothetical protein